MFADLVRIYVKTISCYESTACVSQVSIRIGDTHVGYVSYNLIKTPTQLLLYKNGEYQKSTGMQYFKGFDVEYTPDVGMTIKIHGGIEFRVETIGTYLSTVISIDTTKIILASGSGVLAGQRLHHLALVYTSFSLAPPPILTDCNLNLTSQNDIELRSSYGFSFASLPAIRYLVQRIGEVTVSQYIDKFIIPATCSVFNNLYTYSGNAGYAVHFHENLLFTKPISFTPHFTIELLVMSSTNESFALWSLPTSHDLLMVSGALVLSDSEFSWPTGLSLRPIGLWYKVLLTRGPIATDIYAVSSGGSVKRYTAAHHLPAVAVPVPLYIGQAYVAGSNATRISEWPNAGRAVVDNIVVWRRALKSTVVRDLWRMAFTVAAEFSEYAYDFDIDYFEAHDISASFPLPWWPAIESVASSAPMDPLPKAFSGPALCINLTEARRICLGVYDGCGNVGSNESRASLVRYCVSDYCRSESNYKAAIQHFVMFYECNATSLIGGICASHGICNNTPSDVVGKLPVFRDQIAMQTANVSKKCVSLEFNGYVNDLQSTRTLLSEKGTYLLFNTSNITCYVVVDYVNLDFHVTSMIMNIMETSLEFNSDWNKDKRIGIKINNTLHNITSNSIDIGQDTVLLRNESDTLMIKSSDVNIFVNYVGRYIELYVCEYEKFTNGLLHNSSFNISKYKTHSQKHQMLNVVISLEQSMLFLNSIRISRSFTINFIFETDAYDITLISFSTAYIISIDNNGYVELSCHGVVHKTNIHISLNQWTQLVVTMGLNNSDIYAFVGDTFSRDTLNVVCAIDVIGLTFGGQWRGKAIKTRAFSGSLALLAFWSVDLHYSQVLQLRWRSVDVDQMPDLQVYVDALNLHSIVGYYYPWHVAELRFTQDRQVVPLFDHKFVHGDDTFHNEACDFSEVATICRVVDLNYYETICRSTIRNGINELLTSMLFRCRFLSLRGLICTNVNVTNPFINAILVKHCSPCIYGTILNDSTCTCLDGYWGVNCLRRYPYNSNGICSGNGFGNAATGACECEQNYDGIECETLQCAPGFSGNACQYGALSYNTSNLDYIVAQLDHLMNLAMFNSITVKHVLSADSYLIVRISDNDFSMYAQVDVEMGLARTFALSFVSEGHMVRVELTGSENLYRIVTEMSVYNITSLIKIEGITFNPRYHDLLIITIHNLAIEVRVHIFPSSMITTISLNRDARVAGLLKECSSTNYVNNNCFDRFRITPNIALSVPLSIGIPSDTCLSFSNSSMTSDPLPIAVGSLGLTIEFYININSEIGFLYEFDGISIVIDKFEIIVNDGIIIFNTGLYINDKLWIQLNFHWALDGMFTIIMNDGELQVTKLNVRNLKPNLLSVLSIGTDTLRENSFNGKISSIRIWNRPLSASLVKTYAMSSITLSSPGLLYAWNLQEGFGDEIYSLDYRFKFSTNSSFPKWIACSKKFRTITGITHSNNLRRIEFNQIFKNHCLQGLEVSHRKKCLLLVKNILRNYFYSICLAKGSLAAFDEYCYTLRYTSPLDCKIDNSCCKYGNYDWSMSQCRCEIGKWGDKCDKQCPLECKNLHCHLGKCKCSDHWSELCSNCAIGWVGTDCKINVNMNLKERYAMVQGNFALSLDGISYDGSSLIGHLKILENEVLEIQMVFSICIGIPGCRNLNEIIVVHKLNNNIYNIDTNLQITRKGRTKSAIIENTIVETGITIDLDSTQRISIVFDKYLSISIARSQNNYLYCLIDNIGSGIYSGILGNGNFAWEDDVNFGYYESGIHRSLSNEELLKKYLSLNYLTDNLYKLYNLNSTTSYSKYPPTSLKRIHSNAGYMINLKNSPLIINSLKAKLTPFEMFEFSFHITLQPNKHNINVLKMKFSEHPDLIMSIDNKKWLLKWQTCYLHDLQVSYEIWLSIIITWYSRTGNCSLKINDQTNISNNKTFIGEIVTIDSIVFETNPPTQYNLDRVILKDIDDKLRLSVDFNEGEGNITKVIVSGKNGKPEVVYISIYDQEWKPSTLEIKEVIKNIVICNTSSSCSIDDPKLNSMKLIYEGQCNTELLDYMCSTMKPDNECSIQEPIAKVDTVLL